MPGRLGAVAAGGHVAPATASVLGRVEEHTGAAHVRATPHTSELAGDERVCRRLDHGNHEPGEGIANGHERARERPVALEVDAARARATTENAVDLAQSVETHAVARDPALRQRPQRGTNPTGIDQ